MSTKKIAVYECFIASPSDTSEQRKACKTVFEEINLSLGKSLNFRIESKMWEDNAHPAFGNDGQEVINNQLLDNFQLFIGIMWGKFGTQTSRAGSGTEEEFNIAYSKSKESTAIDIMLYFNNEPIPPNDIQTDQLEKVKTFKNRVSDLGAGLPRLC